MRFLRRFLTWNYESASSGRVSSSEGTQRTFIYMFVSYDARATRSCHFGSSLTCHRNSATTIAMGMAHSKKRMMTPPACEPPASCDELVVEGSNQG